MSRIPASLILAIALCWIGTASVAQEMTTAAEESSQAVMQRFGTSEALQAQGAMPLSTDATMSTVDGATTFNAKVACRESEEFMRVTMVPSGTMDIDQLVVELDMNMDGTRETINNVSGPFAGVCINGMVRCDAGTFNNCQMMQWQASAAGVGLIPTTTRDVGSCYCFNGSCGSNLLMVNNQKILSDISTGIAQSMNAVQPRLVLGRTSLVDPLSMTQYGQLASCGTDNQPEQYYNNAAALPAAGRAAGAQPNSPESILRGSPVMAEHGLSEGRCVMDRVINHESLTTNDILSFGGASMGGATSCGPGCIEFLIGRVADNYYGAGRCTVIEQTMSVDVYRPDRIDNVTLTSVGYDDAQQFVVNDAVTWTSDARWTVTGPYGTRCDNRRNYRFGLAQDVTGAFVTVGRSHLRLRTAVEGNGEGWLYFRAYVREGCAITNEEIVDGCASFEANPECSVMNEVVDGVTTVSNHLTTGLAPLPSARQIGPESCGLNSGLRDWWRTQRIYTCRTGTASYDGREARRRADVVQGSVDMGTGAYTDERQLTPGTYTTSSEALSFPTAPYSPRPRPQVCKTVKPRPGIEIAGGQAVNNLNTTGVANDFTFKECSESGECPLEPGETMVSACADSSNFAQAAAMMQTIRQIGQDTQCVAP